MKFPSVADPFDVYCQKQWRRCADRCYSVRARRWRAVSFARACSDVRASGAQHTRAVRWSGCEPSCVHACLLSQAHTSIANLFDVNDVHLGEVLDDCGRDDEAAAIFTRANWKQGLIQVESGLEEVAQGRLCEYARSLREGTRILLCRSWQIPLPNGRRT